MSEPIPVVDGLGSVLYEMLYGDTKLMIHGGRRFYRTNMNEHVRAYFWEHKPGWMKLIEEDDWPAIHELSQPRAPTDDVWWATAVW
jgi:hypothetical protein